MSVCVCVECECLESAVFACLTIHAFDVVYKPNTYRVILSAVVLKKYISSMTEYISELVDVTERQPQQEKEEKNESY